jgi:hypothetical protein
MPTRLPEYTIWTNAPDIAAIPHTPALQRAGQCAFDLEGCLSMSHVASGSAPLGYNDTTLNMDCATLLPYGANPANRYPTAYFRKTFKIVNPSVVTGLVVRARINDGMVLYLNGVEQKRVYMPDGAVSHSTLATMSVPSTLGPTSCSRLASWPATTCWPSRCTRPRGQRRPDHGHDRHRARQ